MNTSDKKIIYKSIKINQRKQKKKKNTSTLKSVNYTIMPKQKYYPYYLCK